MEFWQGAIVITALLLAALLAAAEVIRGSVGALGRVGIPASIIAGVIGFVLGPSLAGWLPMDTDVLKSGVYHALAIVFIAVSLQTPEARPGEERTGAGVKAMAFGITAMVGLQTLIGLVLAMGLGVLSGEALHPGFGLILPMGFEQGPGQALAMGKAWEATGMTSGADVGLIVAALGYAWAVFVGVPLVAWGKARGLLGHRGDAPEAAAVEESPTLPPGALELLTRQLAAIAVVYLVTYGLCSLASAGLHAAGMHDLGEMVWGFHFMIGALVAMLARSLLARLPGPPVIHSGLQGRIAGVTVDLATVAALCAIELSVFSANLLPILAVTTIGGLATVVACVWLSRRAFPVAPFEHCVMWFGMSTGTMPMGLALLRIIDPELRSPAPVSAVAGSALSIAGVAPILLVLHPMAIAAWGEGYPASGFTALAATALYVAGTLVAWRLLGGLQAGLAPATPWPALGVR